MANIKNFMEILYHGAKETSVYQIPKENGVCLKKCILSAFIFQALRGLMQLCKWRLLSQ